MKPERLPWAKKLRAPLPPVFNQSGPKDSVEVYCRIKPYNEQSTICVFPYDHQSIKLTPPENSHAFRHGTGREQLYKFHKVFTPLVPQKEIFDSVAKPLISDLVAGKNGLLFAYGITGSGKTYTIQGTPQDGGIIRRAIDVLFNSISDCQARKYIFKPDRLNGFDVQSEADALLDRQRLDLLPYYGKTPRKLIRKENSSTHSDDATPDSSKVSTVEDDNVYSIFVTYIEMYNNYTYDLLEEFAQNNMIRDLQSKILREDPKHNMYVHGCTEVEVKSPKEAMEVFYKGQNRRKIAQTKLNWESSRSHSVFTLRAVQAPLDERGEEVVTHRNAMTVSQLSIVDLAGSERTTRTGATGDRLKECGNINNSLMCLRQCIEILRENQQNGTNRKVPYRDSKITHYFKNYFEGEGSVKMVVCVNPLADYFDETLGVMKFADLASEVKIHRPAPPRKDLGFTPGRRKANLMFKEVQKKLLEEERPTIKTLEIDLDNICNIPSWSPPTSFGKEDADSTTGRVKEALKRRIVAREKSREEIQSGGIKFSKQVDAIEKENIDLKRKANCFKSLYEDSHKKIRLMQSQLSKAESTNESLNKKFTDYNALLDDYKQACDERDMARSQGLIEKQRIKTRAKVKIETERERMRKEMQAKLFEQKEQLKNDIITTVVGLGVGQEFDVSTPMKRVPTF